MASQQWTDVRAYRICDGDTDIESSASESVATRIATKLLRSGMSAAAFAAVAELDLQEIDHIRQAMLGSLAGSSIEVVSDQPSILNKLCDIPAEFVCPRTGTLMSDPVVDVDGVSCENGAAGATSLPNLYLKGKINVFKQDRVREIFMVIPDLLGHSPLQDVEHLVAHAAGLVRGDPSHAEMLKEVLDCAVALPGDQQQYRSELVRLLANQGHFPELAERFNSLDVPTVGSTLSLKQASALYIEARGLAQRKGGDALRARQVEAGRLLLAKQETTLPVRVASRPAQLLPSVGTWCPPRPGACKPEQLAEGCGHVAFDDHVMARLWHLVELYEAEPATDLCEKLAEAFAVEVPLHLLQSVFERLPTPALEAAAEEASRTAGCPTRRALPLYLAAAKRVEATSACKLYRHALLADRTCAEAHAGLTELLLEDVRSGKAAAGVKAELAQLLTEGRSLDILAEHLEVLGDFVDLKSLTADFGADLAEALFGRGCLARAAGTAVLAAQKFEDAAEPAKAMDLFARAFQWNKENTSAEEGMKRLAVVTGSKQQAAACLLMAIAQDATSASRVASAMSLLDSHYTSMVRSIETACKENIKENIKALEHTLGKHCVRLGVLEKTRAADACAQVPKSSRAALHPAPPLEDGADDSDGDLPWWWRPAARGTGAEPSLGSRRARAHSGLRGAASLLT